MGSRVTRSIVLRVKRNYFDCCLAAHDIPRLELRSSSLWSSTFTAVISPANATKDKDSS